MSEALDADRQPAMIPGWAPAWSLTILAIGAFAAVLGACLFLSVRAARAEQVARLHGAITAAVQAQAQGLESPDAAAARAAETLASLPQVARVNFLAPRPDDRWIAGMLRLRGDAPVRLLSIDLHPGARTIGPMHADSYRLAVDDHRINGPLERAQGRELVEAGGLALAGLTLLGLAAAAGGAERVRTASERVRLLSWLGASPGRLVAMASRSCWSAATGAIWAGVGAAAAVGLRPGAGAALLVAPRSDAVILAASVTLLGGPLLAAVLFAASAGATLKRLEAR